MNALTLTKILSPRSLFDLILLADDPQPKAFSAADFGYEISADELTNAMAAHMPGDLINPSAPQVGPDEFDAIYKWFIS